MHRASCTTTTNNYIKVHNQYCTSAAPPSSISEILTGCEPLIDSPKPLFSLFTVTLFGADQLFSPEKAGIGPRARKRSFTFSFLALKSGKTAVNLMSAAIHVCVYVLV